MTHVLGIRIAELLRYYTPIVWQFFKINTGHAWHCMLRSCRLCLDLCARLLRRTRVLIAAFFHKIYTLLRRHLPIVLHYLGTSLQMAWRATGSFCRSLLQHAVKVARAIALGLVTVCVLTIRFIHSLIHHSAFVVASIWRWTTAGVRHYLPLILQAAGRGLQATAHALIRCCRWFIQYATRMARVVLRTVLAILAFATEIIRKLLLAVKNLLLPAGRALITFCRVAGRYIGYSVRYLLHTSGIIAARAGERLYQYALLARLNKPIGILLLLWPTLWALWIAAEGAPDLPILLIFIGGVVLMRSAGCIINDLADRDFDAYVSRTR